MRYNSISKSLLSGFLVLDDSELIPDIVQIVDYWLPKGRSSTMHSHEGWEVHLQVSGGSIWTVEGKRKELYENQLMLVPPRVRHRLDGGKDSDHHLMALVFNATHVFERLRDLEKYWISKEIIFLPSSLSIFNAFQSISRDVQSTDEFTSYALRASLDSFIVETTRLLSGNTKSLLLSQIHPGVLNLKSAIEHEPQRSWNLKEFAEIAGLTPRYLALLFSKQMGRAPYAFLIHCRVNMAKALMVQKDLPLTEIALESGFCSSQHFSRIFKKETGLTPLQYRKAIE